MSIRTKVILSIALVFAIGAGATTFFLRQTYESSVQEAARQAISRDAAVFLEIERADSAKLSATDLALEQNDGYRTAFIAGDRPKLAALVAPIFAKMKNDFDVTHWYFESAGATGTVFFRAHRPEQFGDVLTRKTYLRAVKTRHPGVGLELGATAVALRVVRPYYSQDGTKLIGYMELGEEVNGFLSGIQKQTGDHVGLLLSKSSIDASGWASMRKSSGLRNNWSDQAGYVLAATTNYQHPEEMTFSGSVDSVPNEGQSVGVFSEEGGRKEVRGVFPVTDVAGKRIGLVFVDHDVSAVVRTLSDNTIKVLATALGMFAVVLLVVIVLLNSNVFGRLDKMIAGMESISTQIAGGDYNVRYEASGSADEIGRFEKFFGQFTALVSSALKTLSDEVHKK